MVCTCVLAFAIAPVAAFYILNAENTTYFDCAISLARFGRINIEMRICIVPLVQLACTFNSDYCRSIQCNFTIVHSALLSLVVSCYTRMKLNQSEVDVCTALALATDRKSKWNSYYAVKQCMFCMFSKQIRLADMNIQHAQFSSSRLSLSVVRSIYAPLHVYMILHMLNHNGKTEWKTSTLLLMLVVCTFFNPKSNSNCQLCEC